jgi:hypothetical protein
MLTGGDYIVFYGLLGLLIFIILRPVYRRFKGEPGTVGSPVQQRHAVVKMLEEQGYRVYEGKQKVEIQAFIDDKEVQSRVYADYLAERDGKRYVVKVAKSRDQFRLTGAYIRDTFHLYQWIFQPDGILYVNKETNRTHLIRFAKSHHRSRTRFPVSVLFCLSLGIIIGLLIKG